MGKAYLVAIEGCTLHGLREAVHRLIRGEVEEHNGKFIPSTAILGRVVRYEDDTARIKAAHAKRVFIERKTYENVVQLDDATKARRKAQIADLLKNIDAKMNIS